MATKIDNYNTANDKQSTSNSSDKSSDNEKAIKEAKTCMGIGAGVGIAGIASTALLGATCPICYIAAPALIGAGYIAKKKAEKKR